MGKNSKLNISCLIDQEDIEMTQTCVRKNKQDHQELHRSCLRKIQNDHQELHQRKVLKKIPCMSALSSQLDLSSVSSQIDLS